MWSLRGFPEEDDEEEDGEGRGRRRRRKHRKRVRKRRMRMEAAMEIPRRVKRLRPKMGVLLERLLETKEFSEDIIPLF